jgi:hypothetical protein
VILTASSPCDKLAGTADAVVEFLKEILGII